MAFYVLFGAAALHPSMRELSERAHETDQRHSSVAGSSCSPAPRSWRRSLLAYEVAQGRHAELPGVDRRHSPAVHPVRDPHVGPDAAPAGVPRARAALREAGADLVTATSREPRSTRRPAARSSGSPATTHAVRICEIEPGVRRAAGRRRRSAARTAPRSATIRSVWTSSRVGSASGSSTVTAYQVIARRDVLARAARAARGTHHRVRRAAVHRATSCAGFMVVEPSAELPRQDGRSRSRVADLTGRPRARERGADRGPADPAEPGAVRLAREELLGPRDGDRARHDDPLREPVGASVCSGVRSRRAGGPPFRRPDRARGSQRARCPS